MSEPIKVVVGKSVIVFDFAKKEWIPETQDDFTKDIAMDANLLTMRFGDYSSPSMGQPGFALAHAVAKRLGGKAVLPKVKPGKEGTVY